MRVVGEKWQAFLVVGFGQSEFNCISVEVDASNGKRKVTYPDLSYVAKCDHGGDYS